MYHQPVMAYFVSMTYTLLLKKSNGTLVLDQYRTEMVNQMKTKGGQRAQVQKLMLLSLRTGDCYLVFDVI